MSGEQSQLERVTEREEVAEGFTTTRAQKRRPMEKKEERRNFSGQEVKKGMITHQAPAYHFESKISDPQAANQIFQHVLEVEVPNIKVKDLLSLSGDLRKIMVENTYTHKSPVVNAAVVAAPDMSLEFATPLQEVKVELMGEKQEAGLLDEGSEIVVIRKDLYEELGLEVNWGQRMVMQTANRGKEDLEGCVEYLEVDVGGIKTYTHAFVVQTAPYRLLLGRPWQKGVRLGKVDNGDGTLDMVVTDPVDERWKVVVPTRERRDEQMKRGLMILGKWSSQSKELEIQGKDDTLIEVILANSFTYDPTMHCLAYKKVANKVQLVPGKMPSNACVIRQFPKDPLLSMPTLSPYPPTFTPGVRLTQEWMDGLGLFTNKFLMKEE